MIDINKQYRTRNGLEVKIYAIHLGQDYPVHGAISNEDAEWYVTTWSILGDTFAGRKNGTDLVEVKPRIQGEVWLNLYENGTIGLHQTREDADRAASPNRFACIRREYDAEEGDGLDT